MNDELVEVKRPKIKIECNRCKKVLDQINQKIEENKKTIQEIDSSLNSESKTSELSVIRQSFVSFNIYLESKRKELFEYE